MKLFRGFLLLLCLYGLPAAAAPEPYAPLVEGILAAWGSADVVCLGEDHGRKHDSDLRLALVRHPKFPQAVDLIVVEFANPAHQALLDRFILEGAEMTRDELAVVWRDASGAEVGESPIYEEFLRTVREVNLGLPRNERVRVIGGDTLIDWRSITTAEQLVPLLKAGLTNRGGNIRKIIAEQVLDKKLKALAIYGSGHCVHVAMGFPGELEDRYPGRFWSVSSPYSKNNQEIKEAFGFGDKPAYLVVKGTKWAAMSAAGLFLTRRQETIGRPVRRDRLLRQRRRCRVVPAADPAELRTKYGAEGAALTAMSWPH